MCVRLEVYVCVGGVYSVVHLLLTRFSAFKEGCSSPLAISTIISFRSLGMSSYKSSKESATTNKTQKQRIHTHTHT
eukprot:m.208318 g.208318  ORF g.208318 m.208318 type:complete len:76 (+) comp13764_c1_seq5:165-392(+)